MLAYHPITGKEIRIIQTDASIWKENKTLIYSGAKSAYDTIYSSGSPTYRLQLVPASAAELVEGSQKSNILFLSNNALTNIGIAEFKRLKIQNVINLEELHNLFPHIGGEWDGTLDDAIIMIAGLMRYKRVGGVELNARASLPALGLVKVDSAAPRLWWVTQYYKHSSPKRQEEINTCLKRNSNSKLIDKIVLLNEKVFNNLPSGSVPIEQRNIGKRITYGEVIRAAAEFPEDVIVAFANADICIDDESWRDLWKVNMENKFLALLRYDVGANGKVEESKIFGPRADSQDTWVVRAADIAKRSIPEMAKILNYEFGHMGCDNVIALDMLRQKFVVVNPALSLKTWHFHTSDERTYNKGDAMDRPIYHYVQPTGFHDLQPIMKFNAGEIVTTFNPAPLLRHIRGSGATKWISLRNRVMDAGGSENTVLKMENANTIQPDTECFLRLKNCFQTSGGLVFDKERIMVGSASRSQKLWSNAQIGTLTPSLECKRGLAVPWPSSSASGAGQGEVSREIYMLKYLSKILQMAPFISSGSTGSAASIIGSQGWEFFCPEKKDIIEALESFDWRTAKLPVIKYDSEMVVWCSDLLCMPPSENETVLIEDVVALRNSVHGWSPAVKSFSNRRRLVIVEDEQHVKESLARELEELADERYDVRVVYPGRTSAHRMTEILSGAWGIVCGNGIQANGWNWMLPGGAYCFELGGDANMEGLGVSSASGLQHRFCSLGSAAAAAGVANLYREICKEEDVWLRNNRAVDASLPLIWMPRSDIQGYFGHAGDSFREMVRLWEKAGYCCVKEHESATMVWWGEVGKNGVLLYDRPNHDWRLAAPAIEKEWKFALFGNPKPPSSVAGGKSSPWFFWPRRPELVESLTRNMLKTWDQRDDGMVFFGKIENKLQARRRGGDWSAACSKWNMARDDEPHALSQQGYLEALASSRFGLCLAGYGYKCHREVECMAVGCVPICASDVDMSSYAVPPLEGVHYIRVSSPSEATSAMAAMDEAAWEKMSAAGKKWWKDNCSCSASFALTARLVSDSGAFAALA